MTDETRVTKTYQTHCPRCLQRSGTITMPKVLKAAMPQGGYVYGTPGDGVKNVKEAVRQQGIDPDVLQWEEVAEGEPIPAQDTCDTCRLQLLRWKAEVDKGGVYAECSDCRREWVIPANSQASVQARKHMGVLAPNPCKVTFKECGEHGGAVTAQEAKNDTH